MTKWFDSIRSCKISQPNMRKKLGRPAILYPLAVLLILGWWTLALSPVQTAIPRSHVSTQPIQASLKPFLRPIRREELHLALQGDCKGMLDLITEWDAEAQLLQAQGVTGVRRLDPDQFLRAQLVGRRLLAPQADQEKRYHWEVDDLGMPLHLSKPPTRFLPQTELAASVILALASPDQVVALPSRMRRQKLFPDSLLQQVPLDIDRYQSERIFLANPEVVFVAHYTQPSIIETLRNQGIALFTLNRLGSLSEVQQTIQKIGHVAGQSEKAELLNLFMNAGFAALDNRLLQCNAEKVVYLNYYTQFSIPGERHLMGQLIKRLGINRSLSRPASGGWQIVYNSEQIANSAPEVIIVSSSPDSPLVDLILHNPALQQTPAVRMRKVFSVDETVQDSPTQFLLLAYYDLATILLGQS